MKIFAWMGLLGALGLAVGLGNRAQGQNQDHPPGSAVVEGNEVTDADITAAIESKLQQSRMLRQSAITVVTKNGEVTLVGTIPSEFARRQAMDAVNSTPGVLRTNDQLRLISSSPQAPTRQ